MPEWLALLLICLVASGIVSVVGSILTRRYLESVYRRRFAQLIRESKRERPDLAPYIDQQTVKMGMGVIDAEG